jgi:hypothetical protein
MGSTANIAAASLLAVALLHGQTDQQIDSALQEHFKHWGYSTVSWNPSWAPFSQEDAARLEVQLRAVPEDSKTRVRLLNYYWHNGLREQRAPMVFWLIESHPESPVLGLDIAWLFDSGRDPGDHYRAMHDPADFARARVLWEAVFARGAELPAEALHNAARFFETTDPVRSEELAKRLEEVDPVGHGKVVSTFLSQILPALHR